MTYTYADLRLLCEGLIGSAREAGLLPSHRVALVLPRGPDAVIVTAALAHGLSVLPLNPALADDELVAAIEASGADAILSPSCFARGGAIARRTKTAVLELHGFLISPTGQLRPPARERSIGLVLLTSGSTGEPKRVPLSPSMLWESAAVIAESLELSRDDRAAHVLPHFHIGALVDLFLAPLLARGSVAFGIESDPRAIQECVLGSGATWLQLVPTMLARCLAEFDRATAARLSAQLRFIRSVSADLSPDLQRRGEEFFGQVPIVQIYGMTETAGQIAANPLPPRLRKPGTVGPPAGPDVALLDATGAIVNPGSEGEVCVRGPSVMQGYEGGFEDHFFGSWLRTGDLGRFDEDGFLVLTGRLKDMINRGGEKIAPVEIERAALALDGVVEAAAFAMPHPTLGEEPALAVVLRHESALNEAAVRALIGERVAEFKVPRSVTILAQLPRLGSGKIDRQGLRRGDLPPPDVTPANQLSPVGETVQRLWGQLLQLESWSPGDDFFDVGGDSLSATTFLLQLEEQLGRRIPGNILFEAPRFCDFVARLEERLAVEPAPATDPINDFVWRETSAWLGERRSSTSLLIGMGTSGAEVPLFFCAQGQAEIMPIRAVLSPERPMYVMRSLYLWDQRALPATLDLAARYAREIEEVRPSGPLLLGGFCEGAVVMSEVARILCASGRDVALFVSIDHWFSAPTGYPVFHVWTECPRYSAINLLPAPQLELPFLHPAGARGMAVSGVHGAALTRENLAHVGEALEACLAGRDSIGPSYGAARHALPEQKTIYSAQLDARVPRFFTKGVSTGFAVLITNTSSQTWQASRDSGLALVAHFLHLDGRIHVANAARSEFCSPLGPGTTVELSVKVTYPSVTTPLVLQLNLVQEGLGPAGSQPSSTVVWFTPST